MSDFGRIWMGFAALGVFMFLISGQSMDYLAHETGMFVLTIAAAAFAIGMWKIIRG